MPAAEKNSISIEWGFLGLFVLYICIFVGMAEIGQGFMLTFREFTTSSITAFWGFFSVPVLCSGTQFTLSGFSMEIVLECTALHYMIIFISGVLAFRSHTVSYRAVGIVFGTLSIFLLNIFRIGVIGFIGRYFNGIFDFVHDYLWQGMFALCVVLLWVIWVNGTKVFTRKLIGSLLIVSASASLSFWFAVTFLQTYIAFIAALSNIMFPILSLFAEVPQRVMTDGRLIGYVVGNEVTYSKLPLYFLNAALLFPIASITFVRTQSRLFLKRISVAAIFLLVQHMLIIALDWMLELTVTPGIHSVIIWSIVMSTFIAPMLIWLIVMKIFPGKTVHENRAPDQ